MKQQHNTTDNILCVDKKICTGCGACANICPVQAIKMERDSKGFLYPNVNECGCIACGKCFRICPAANYEFKNKPQTKCYAAMAIDDIRLKSSSGGMFGALANFVLDNNGYVCGVKYKDDYIGAEQIIIHRKEDLNKLYKSKYVQSDTSDSFIRIKELLDANKMVLFCATPCQVAGLQSFLGKDYKNLITCDILCHGVASPVSFKSYLNDIADGRQISSIDFRSKEYRGWGSFAHIKFNDGTEYFKNWSKDPWYLGFLSGITTRESCGTCKYAQRNRVGDFTFGDFWGIDRQNPNYNDKMGTSIVLLNNDKAHHYLKKIKQYLKLFKVADLEMAASNNNVLNFPAKLHPNRDAFFEKLPRRGYELSFNYIYNKYDIGIIGFWDGNNYGSFFTYYALSKALKGLGKTVCLIERPYCAPQNVDRSTLPYRFFLKYLNLKMHVDFYSMNNLNNMCRGFILGSDQVFAYPCIKNREQFYLLNFADDDKKKIAYSCSFGHSKLLNPANKIEMFKYSLERFDAISVREKKGVELCKELGLEATFVLDPVFLCDKKEYVKLAVLSKKQIAEPYFLAYILDVTDEKRNAILYLEKKLNMKARILLAGMEDFEYNKAQLRMDDQIIKIDDMEDFFYYYNNCSFVLTDSYHGTCSAIIFEKNFISIENPKRGTSRTDTLKDVFKIDKKVCASANDIISNKELLNPPDFVMINDILLKNRAFSLRWLENALNN